MTEKVQKAKEGSNRTFKWRNILEYDVSGILTYLNKDKKDSKHDWILTDTTLIDTLLIIKSSPTTCLRIERSS